MSGESQRPYVVSGASADTRHPPDVHTNTHIIGVLGVNDTYEDAGSPAEDGWMVSDFYLWKHLLHGMGKSQRWLTCEDPRYLLNKYASGVRFNQDEKERQVSWNEGYMHGDPFEERAVVLDYDTLPFAESNLMVTARDVELRNTFLNVFQDTCTKAAQSNDRILILIFSHGALEGEDYQGLTLGTNPGQFNLNLTPRMIAKTYYNTPNVHLSIFHTSCYSGHWVITPHLSLNRPTMMAAALQDQESYSWTESASQRHAGGVFTSSFLAELIKEPIEVPKDDDEHQARLYKELTTDILIESARLCVPERLEFGGSTPVFTEEGALEPAYRRTGFALYAYKANYDKLRKFPASDPHPTRDKKRDLDSISDEEIRAWEARNPEAIRSIEHIEKTAGYGSTRRGLKSSTVCLTRYYMTSYPGPKEAAGNTALHSKLRSVAKGKINKKPEELEELRRVLIYRLWLMNQANRLIRMLDLHNKVPLIDNWDSERARAPNTYATIYHRLFSSGAIRVLFFSSERAPKQAGHAYLKPFQYFCFALATTGFEAKDFDQIVSKIAAMNQAINSSRAEQIHNSLRMSADKLKELSATFRGSKVKRRSKRISLSEAGLRPDLDESSDR